MDWIRRWRHLPADQFATVSSRSASGRCSIRTIRRRRGDTARVQRLPTTPRAYGEQTPATGRTAAYDANGPDTPPNGGGAAAGGLKSGKSLHTIDRTGRTAADGCGGSVSFHIKGVPVQVARRH